MSFKQLSIRQFPKTKETFTFSGRLFIVCSSSISHRYGSVPRNILLPSDIPSTSEDFWESERLRLWKRLNPTYRASWTWPASGEHRGPGPASAEWNALNKEAGGGGFSSSHSGYGSLSRAGQQAAFNPSFKYTKLDATDDRDSGSSKGKSSSPSASDSMSKEDELRCAHNIALDNFCILVFKIARVDHIQPSSSGSQYPPVRKLYASTKDGAWLVEEVNP
jgi:hypothetical protein